MFYLLLAFTLAVTSPTVIDVEIASTPEELRRGLQGRLPLVVNEGMLFILGAPTKARFWMKDVTFPIDIVFLQSDGTVDHIANAVPPCPGLPCPTYASRGLVSYVLEIPAGWAAAHGLAAGDAVRVHVDRAQVHVPPASSER